LIGVRAYVGITDGDWFKALDAQSNLEEVNFWQPGGNRAFRALEPGELFLFKLHSPRNYIVGGGLFAHATILPISLAWSAFEVRNGAHDLLEMRARVAKYRRSPERRASDPLEEYDIGCILLQQPFFLPEDRWVPVPADWKPNIVQGRTYDLMVEPGRTLWANVQLAHNLPRVAPIERSRGAPQLIFPRLGQGSFRVLVTDAYARRCAISNERTLPALDAAHIVPYRVAGEHRIDNGLLLRKDLHALFDAGYVTVTPEFKVEVSRRIREEFENGRDYYRFHGWDVRRPASPGATPSRAALAYHNTNVFRP
jgi:putative restriction endonuclease